MRHFSPLLLLALTGCIATTTDVDRVSQRVAELERVNSSVMAEAGAATKRLENLAGQVEDANNQLRETLAKAGARIAESDRALQKLRGELEVIVHRLESLERIGSSGQQSLTELRGRLNQLIADLRDRAGIAVLALPSDLPTDADGFVKAADKAMVDGDVRLAAALASECQKRYPASEAWGQCGLVMGRIAAQEARYVDALKQFQAVHDGLGGKPTNAVAQSLVEVAKILEMQGKCQKAVQVWTYLGTEMPKVPQAKQAKTEPAAIAKRCKEGAGVSEKAPGDKPVDPPAAATGESAPAGKSAGSAPVTGGNASLTGGNPSLTPVTAPLTAGNPALTAGNPPLTGGKAVVPAAKTAAPAVKPATPAAKPVVPAKPVAPAKPAAK